MSQTITPGDVGASHWTYMATVMYECLDDVLSEKRNVKVNLPSGVYRIALRFFDLVLQGANGKIPKNPVASYRAYLIAADAVAGSSFRDYSTRADLKKRLEQFRSFIEYLPEKSAFSKDEKEIAESLRHFFINLATEGETEAYQNKIHFNSPRSLKKAHRRNDLSLA